MSDISHNNGCSFPYLHIQNLFLWVFLFSYPSALKNRKLNKLNSYPCPVTQSYFLNRSPELVFPSKITFTHQWNALRSCMTKICSLSFLSFMNWCCNHFLQNRFILSLKFVFGELERWDHSVKEKRFFQYLCPVSCKLLSDKWS